MSFEGLSDKMPYEGPGFYYEANEVAAVLAKIGAPPPMQTEFADARGRWVELSNLTVDQFDFSQPRQYKIHLVYPDTMRMEEDETSSCDHEYWRQPFDWGTSHRLGDASVQAGIRWSGGFIGGRYRLAVKQTFILEEECDHDHAYVLK